MTTLVEQGSRGRSILEVMTIFHRIMETEAKVFTSNERYDLVNTISSKVLAFAFSLSAEIERSMISSRTMEALARKTIEGMRLGRPIGSYAKETKLTGKKEIIQELLEKRVSHSAVAHILGVNRGTLTSFVQRHHLGLH